MKHPLRAAALAAGALLCLSAGRAFAELDYVGDDEGGSWFLGYHLVLPTQQFDEIKITINNGTDFGSGPTFRSHLGSTATVSNFTAPNVSPFLAFAEVPPFPNTNPVHDFSLSSWHQNGTHTTTVADAKGGTTNDLVYWLHLGTGPQQPTAGVRYILEVFNHGHNVANGAVYFKRISTNPNVADELSFVEVVPVPAALWTGLPMLGGMIFLIRRNRRNVLS